MKKLLLLLLGIASIPAAFSQGGSGIDWAADLDYLASELPAKHCNLFAKYDKAQFETAIGAIKASAGEAGDFATALKTQQLIARLGDSHTMLYFNQLMNRQQILPLGLLWVSDGLYVIQTAEENKELLGHRLTAVGKAPVETVIDSLSTLFTVDNEAMVKSMIPQLFPSLQLLEYFGFAHNGQAELTLDGDKTYTLKPSDPQRAGRAAFQPDSLPFAIAERNVLFTDRYFPEEKIYYILYNSCWGRESEAEFKSREKAASLPSFTEFGQKAFGILQGNPVGKIIFDMRNNGGGNSAQGTAFIERLARFLEQHPGIKNLCRHRAKHILLGHPEYDGFQAPDRCGRSRRTDRRQTQPLRRGTEFPAPGIEADSRLFDQIFPAYGRRGRHDHTRRKDRNEFCGFHERHRPGVRMDQGTVGSAIW